MSRTSTLNGPGRRFLTLESYASDMTGRRVRQPQMPREPVSRNRATGLGTKGDTSPPRPAT
jgi:hypothetical protein